MDAIRQFVIQTLLSGDAEAGIDRLTAKAKALTQKAVAITINTKTSDVEKQVASVVNNIKKVAVPAGAKTELKGLTDHIKGLGSGAEAAGKQASNFFNKLDAGRLIVAGAAAGMILYAQNALKSSEALRLNNDMIRDQLGAQSQSALNFIGQGGQTSGTSLSGRSNMMAWMAMTGYKDEAQMKAAVKDTERIMSSTFGQSLQMFGINSGKDLLSALSKPMDETSDLGRVIKSKFPEFFKAGTLQTEKIKVQQESKFAFQSDEVVEAEARRRLASKALQKISSGVEPDKDSYRVGLRDMMEQFDQLNQKVGSAVKPASEAIMQLVITVMKIAAANPEVTAFVASLLGIGVALATAGAVLPILIGGLGSITGIFPTLISLAGKFAATMMANPILLAIALIVIALVLLEAKFHVFSKAWDAFANSAIGKDVFKGLAWGAKVVSDYISSLFDKINQVYEMAKGGNILGALKGGAEILFKLSPLGLAEGFLAGVLPLVTVQKEALNILRDLKSLWRQLSEWIYGLYDKAVGFLGYIWGGLQKIMGKMGIDVVGGAKSLVGAAANLLNPNANAKWTGGPNPGENAADFMKRNSNMNPDELARAFLGPGLDPALYQNYANAFDQARKGDQEALNNLYKDIAAKKGSGVTNINIGSASEAPTPGSKEEAATTKGALQMAQNVVTANRKIVEDTTRNVETPMGRKDIVIRQSPTSNTGTPGFGNGPISASQIAHNAIGGEVQRAGLAWVDEKEPIVPAEISRSSTLIDRLREIASGSGSGSTGPGGGVHIDKIEIVLPSGGQYNAQSIAKEVKNALEKELSSFEFSLKAESFGIRANRALKG